MDNILQPIVEKVLGTKYDELKPELYDGDKLKDNAADVLLTRFNQKFEKHKAEVTEKFNEGHKKGAAEAKAEALSRFESEMKEKLGFNSDLKGIELIQAYGESLKKKSGGTMTDDDVKNTPIYKSLVAEYNQKLEGLKEAMTYKEKYEQFTKQVEFEKKFSVVAQKAFAILDSKRANYGQTDAQIQFNRSIVLDKLKQFAADWQVGSDGAIYALNNEGKQITDNFNNPVKFEDIVSSSSLHITFNAQSDKGGGGSGGAGGGAGAGNEFPTPKTDQEYNELCKKYAGNVKALIGIKANYDAFRNKK